MANVVMNSENPPQFRDIWTAVHTYVSRSAMIAAPSMLTGMLAPAFLMTFQMMTPQNGPNIPMENTLAPRVVRPPWASRMAWKIRTIRARNEVALTPYRTAERPVPVGCELEPVADGSLSDESRKMNAPASATVIFCSGCSRISFTIALAPNTMKGIARMNQTAHQIGSRYPSIMCIDSPSNARRSPDFRTSRGHFRYQ